MNRMKTRLASALLAGTAVIVPGLAFAAPDGAPTATPASAGASNDIIVTATRRAESVRNVPYNISAYSGKALQVNGTVDVSTLTQSVPGLVTSGAGFGNNNNFVMRGINADKTTDLAGQPEGTVAPVATYYGETPIYFPLRMTDIDRVEVLRGPQGTLYGSGALAGAIRFILNRPQFNSFHTNLEADVSGTENAGQPNESFQGMVNLPLVEDRVALRLVGAVDNNAGFIDGTGMVELGANGVPTPRVPGNLASGFVVKPIQKGINRSDTEQGRIELRVQVTNSLDAQVNYTHQSDFAANPQATNPDFKGGFIDNSEENFPGSLFPNIFGVPGGHFWPDGGAVFPTNGRYDQSDYINQPVHRSTDVGDLDLTQDLGFASLTSSTSVYDVRARLTLDETGSYEVSNGAAAGNFAYGYSFYPRMLQIDYEGVDNRGVVEEVRLASTWRKPIDYVVGAYYTNQTETTTNLTLSPGLAQFDQQILPSIGGPFGVSDLTEPDVTYTTHQTTNFSEAAGFGELTWHITPALQVTAGGRAFWESFSTALGETTPYCGAVCNSSASNSTSLSHAIYKGNASYKFNENLMIYGTVSEGFRRGGANAFPLTGPYRSLPKYLTFAPDTSVNYEAGLKGTVLRQSFTLAGFLMDWNNFQFNGSTPSDYPIVFNGSKARSEGFEAEISGIVLPGLTYNAGYTYTKAYVTQAFETLDYPSFSGPAATPKPQYIVLAGNPLPNTPRDTATLGLNYDEPLPITGWDLIWHVSGSYRSGTQSTFGPDSQKGKGYYLIKGFETWNGSLTMISDRHWAVGLFANNIFNTQGITGGLPPSGEGARGALFFIETPRTVGLRLTYSQ